MSVKAILSASVSAPPVYVEDVFSTFLYTGNSSTRTITNGIDLAGEGGLVWIKARNSAEIHNLYDTARGANKFLYTNGTQDQISRTDALTSFTSSGFTLGVDGNYEVNTNSTTYCSWTFRKAPKFFDVVTYTGNGAGVRSIPHSLGSTPGITILKKTSEASDWVVNGHNIGIAAYNPVYLNQTSAKDAFNQTGIYNASSSTFGVGVTGDIPDFGSNVNGVTYVAYLFAHDAGGFGDAGTDNVVSCGTFTTPSSGSIDVNLGWEPQWLLVKASSNTGSWFLFDNMRGWAVGSDDHVLQAHLSDAEFSAGYGNPTATGFTTAGLNSSQTYIYIAIRRGPMKTPTVGTEVFSVFNQSVTSNPLTFTPNFPADGIFVRASNTPTGGIITSRLQGGFFLDSTTTAIESSASYFYFNTANANTEFITGYFNPGFGTIQWLIALRRAPGFFDVVAYTGTGVFNHDVSHNLGVAPELIITKRRNAASTTGWFTSSKYYYDTDLWDRNGRLNDGTIGFSGGGVYGPDANITATQFRIASTAADINASGGTYIAYLFATCPGVSKCGSYTGTGTGYTVDVNCGFTTGARFVLIKRADSAGDWFVWDTARGIISGNDPYLLLNSSAAEVTGTDYIDPLSTGFQISSTAPAAINANGGTYIFLAIA